MHVHGVGETSHASGMRPLNRAPGTMEYVSMPSPIDAVNELIARSQRAQKGEHELLLFLSESLVELQYVLKSEEYDAEKLATIEVHVRDMLRKITHAAEQ